MSGKQADLVSVDLAARAMVATVRSVVREPLEDILQMQACVSTASAESHAYAALDETRPNQKRQRPVARH
jgi:hypothetical protein